MIARQAVNSELLNDAARRDAIWGDIDAFAPGLEVDAVSTQPVGFVARYRHRRLRHRHRSPRSGVRRRRVRRPRRWRAAAFVDGERIEVLKAAGHLFGAQYRGPARFADHPSPAARIRGARIRRVGNYGKRYIDGMFNILMGAFALRINALSNKSDGWIQGRRHRQGPQWRQRRATRAAWQPHAGDDTTIPLSWDHEDLTRNGRRQHRIAPLPAYPQRPTAPADPDTYPDPQARHLQRHRRSATRRACSDGVNLIIDTTPAGAR